MSHSLTETATFSTPITVPDDGDARNAASVNTPFQSLANRTKFFNSFPLRGIYNSTACTDGNVNVDVALGDIFKIPSTLTGNRTYTFSNTAGIPSNSIKWFFRPVGGGVSAHTVTITDGSAASIVSVSGFQFFAGFFWDGTAWHVIAHATTGAAQITSVTSS